MKTPSFFLFADYMSQRVKKSQMLFHSFDGGQFICYESN